ncbi:MAG: membrane fusion protein MtrC, partial [Gemmatimonadota bacterium]|nr:membrane fusion protein MtrC [Gemmatimonadota bacterium]
MRRQLLIALPVVLGCGQADSNGNAAPARVENPTTEAALTTVRITERASERIGIEVAPIERR